MNKKKILTKVALLLILCVGLVTLLASCGGSVIDTSKDLSYWAGTEEQTTSGIETGDETESGTGTAGETITGSESETVTGSESETVTGDESETVTGSESETVTGDESETVTGSESETVSGDESETVSGDESETASGSEPESGDVVPGGSEDGSGNNHLKVELDPGFGFIDTFLSWIGIFLGWITNIMPANTYILTLFVFAIIMEIVLLPFSFKQQKNSIRQAMLRPKEMAIRRRYAGRNDQATQQKITQEIQELYQKENFNPMGGCLPLLIQLPIIFVLYKLVIDPIRYVYSLSSEFSSYMYALLQSKNISVGSTNGSVNLLNKIVDAYHNGTITAADVNSSCENPVEVWSKVEYMASGDKDSLVLNLNIGRLNLGDTPAFSPENKIQLWLLLIPVLTFVVYFLTSKLTRKLTGAQPAGAANDKQAGCSNNMMDITMPLMSVWMTFWVPGLVGIYWIFKSIIGFVKQLILSRVMPLPTFTEEDYKAAEREMFGKQPKKVQKSENAGKVRSLHHIDDEDYDEKGNYIGKPEKHPENKMTEGATLKSESDKAQKESGEEKKKFSLFGKKDKKD